ncbi:hypothetical protein [Lactiplantibacillus plantarum]|uniref:hypothetical protein n=1 Tax=Lactiplantibacillus plantarum TaxID=1590 RepID=UPI0007ABA9A9|nr:hypothetical protein [Lactiplantibacillus plantarum]
MQILFSNKEQRDLRIRIAVKGLKRKDFSNQAGISMPTVKKLLDGECPMIISELTATHLKQW